MYVFSMVEFGTRSKSILRNCYGRNQRYLSHLGLVQSAAEYLVLANMANRKEIFKTVYLENPSTENPENKLPKTTTKVKEGDITIPEFYDSVKPLHQVVDVDYYIPGCPPPPWLILDAFNAIVENKLPPKGSVLAPLKSVCDECRFKFSEKKINTVKRIYELEKIEEKCFLEQSVICMGPATRSGCHGTMHGGKHALYRLSGNPSKRT